MNDIQLKVENHLKNLISNKDTALNDLFYDLGYEYDNQPVDSLFDDWTDNQKVLAKV